MAMQDDYRDHIAKVTIGAGESGDYFSSANAHVGVGDSDAALDPAHTDLQGANKLRKPMQPGYPERANNVLTFLGRFTEEDANFHWKEGSVNNAEAYGLMMCRFLDDQGVKPDNEIWDYQVEITIGHPGE